MLSAFAARPLVDLKQRDKSKIESILLHGDQLLVGLSTGSLRIYRVNEDAPTELLREYEKFSKYKVDQLAIFKEANVLISLSNALCSLHDLSTYDLQEQLGKTKGATLFAVTSNIVNDDNVPVLVSKLAVAVKRRLVLWTWHDGESSGEPKEIALASSIKSLTWASGTKVIAGLTANYVLVDVESQVVKVIVGPGSIGEAGQDSKFGTGTMSYIGMASMVPPPLATGLSEKEMLLARDINTHFIDRDGEAIGRRQIPWRAAPEAVGYSYPYLLALQDSKLEIRNPQTLTQLQSIDLPSATKLQVPNPNISLAHLGKGFLVASERTIWRISGLSYDTQIEALIEGGNFDEAISLVEMMEETLIHDKNGRLRQINMLKAQKLFDDKLFRDSLDLFAEVTSPPDSVIRLYPEVIAGDIARPESTSPSPVRSHKKTASSASNRSKTKDSDQRSLTGSVKSTVEPALSEKDLKEAVRGLQGYLADVRRRLHRVFNPDQSVKEPSELPSEDEQLLRDLLEIKSLDQPAVAEKIFDLARLVDTTLFRAHMFATPSLAGSLVRLPNFCDPEVVMAKLEETGRRNELIDFLYGKRLHRQALERLQKLGKSEDKDSPLHGPARTVAYLQNLPPELIHLILEFSRWPVETDPDLAMQIFTADTENAETLPRSQVLAFLESINKKLALKYLEHVIDDLNDLSPDLHQRLVTLYLELLKSSSSDEEETLEKFVSLLRTSEQFSPAKILDKLPKEDERFNESRAVLLRKLGQHKAALQIYVFKMRDLARAEEYCNQVYLEDKSEPTKLISRRMSTNPVDEEPSIYQVLLNLYLNPPKSEKILLGPAVELMARHGARLPASSTLDMIPTDLLVKELEFYFRGRIRNANTVMKDSSVEVSLRKVDALHVSAALLVGDIAGNGGRARKVRVDEDRICGVCHKRLGGSVISVFPEYVHPSSVMSLLTSPATR